MEKSAAEWRLLIIWCVGAAVVFCTMLVQQLGGALTGGDATKAWGWFTAMALPIPLLLVGAVLTPAPESKDGTAKAMLVERRIVQLLVGISIAYLVVLELSTLRFMFQSSRSAVDILTESSAYVAPIQGVATLAFGRLFGTVSAKPA